MPTALLIIDVQQGLCSGQWAMFEADRVIDRINLVSEKARAAGALVVVIQHESQGTGEMEHGSDAWQLAANLKTAGSDVFVRKTAPDSFHKTKLQDVLESNGIDRLILCGFQSDFCVDTTARRALSLGYPSVLVSDGHSTMDNSVLTAAQISAHHAETLANIESFGPRVVLVPAGDVRIEA